MCGQKVSVSAATAPVRLNRQQPATAVTVLRSVSRCVITTEALVLFELSREESPPQQH